MNIWKGDQFENWKLWVQENSEYNKKRKKTKEYIQKRYQQKNAKYSQNGTDKTYTYKSKTESIGGEKSVSYCCLHFLS
jgi:uncharacterized protein YxeA